MSGIGKTMLARKFPSTDWFHFSADYRIGTRYLSEAMLDDIKEKAMAVDFLRDLLRSDSIYIANNMTVDNLEPLSKFVGKVGAAERGGLHADEFRRRQRLHCDAEIQSMLDVAQFIHKAHTLYGYDNFVNDSSGSICELNCPQVLEHLAEHTVIVYLAADAELEKTVVERQESNPKPLFYAPDFFDSRLAEYLQMNGLKSDQQIDPDEFVRWIFPSLIDSRRRKYEAIAEQYGYTVAAGKIETVRDDHDFVEMLCQVMDESRHS